MPFFVLCPGRGSFLPGLEFMRRSSMFLFVCLFQSTRPLKARQFFIVFFYALAIDMVCILLCTSSDTPFSGIRRILSNLSLLNSDKSQTLLRNHNVPSSDGHACQCPHLLQQPVYGNGLQFQFACSTHLSISSIQYCITQTSLP